MNRKWQIIVLMNRYGRLALRKIVAWLNPTMRCSLLIRKTMHQNIMKNRKIIAYFIWRSVDSKNVIDFMKTVLTACW